ncbi:SAM-dependent methyltransferase [Planctobacterium marinum]|uniref:SAM-dependent methyltransferase n=1 Tax=Planctobacterium marinum TaxID=1631968 RepID=A0AA48KPU2_9ALTE|nr:SAM-dependent methyltransferase [Planctobacterium marinum]
MQYPQLADSLLELSDEQLRTLEHSPEQLHGFLHTHLAEYGSLLAAIQLPKNSRTITPPKFSDIGIPGRKWQQILAFLATPHTNSCSTTNLELVDWCAGKAHLGRVAALIRHTPLTAIEYNSALCEEGLKLAQKSQTKAEFICADVLSSRIEFSSNQEVMALHACGDLHRKLLANWKQSDSAKLVLAPCCYEKWLKDDYFPLSTQGIEHNLNLTPAMVKLAMQETVTAPEREQILRHKLQTARLAFDILQRQVRGVDEYWQTPSLALSKAHLPVEELVQLMAQHKGLSLPAEVNYIELQCSANTRYQQSRRLGLAAQGFRRALELWLVSDLALYLEQDDILVELHEFCERSLTPRNIQLTAFRR